MPPARRPAFAADFPADPELDALVGAFAAGDYRAVRDRAPRLAASSSEPGVRAAAAALLERTKPDPLALVLMGITAALLVSLSVYWIGFGQQEHGSPKPAVERVK